MAIINKPDMTNLWASGGAIIAPSGSKVQTGWTAEIPPHQWENWVQNRQDLALGYLFQRGLAEWDSTTEYYANQSVVLHEGTIYIANTNNVGEEPSDVSAGWRTLFSDIPRATEAEAELGVNDTSLMTPAKTAILFPFRGIQVYDTPGVHTWNVPDGVSKVWVTVIGGGGGGGGVQTTAGVSAAGGGGGGGGGVQELIEVISVESVTVTVGAGGVGGQLSNGWSGLQGGTSSFGAYCSASGGRGGNGGSVSSNTVFSGAGGGEGVGGDINSVGNGGTDGTFSSPSGASVFGGNGGGPSFLGGGADGGAAGSAGNDAVGSGSGGAGAAAVGNSAHRGGNGAPGKIIIQW